jgi:hypothetical protein
MAMHVFTFRYKQELDSEGLPLLGLFAEEVEVNPDLVKADAKAKAKAYTVRYDAVIAMLLNEFLKEHRKVENLEATVAQQRKDFQAITTQQQKEFESKIALQQKQIEALTAGLQKMRARLEMSRPASQVAEKQSVKLPSTSRGATALHERNRATSP